MLDWFEGLAGPAFATAVLWTFAALILLVIVLVIIKLIRSMTFGTFVAGGRNRKTRLAVMDATAVDSHRRLVLVRRDDIEHLILIGGPTDVVVEREIRYGQSRRPAFIGEGSNEAPPRARLQDPPPARAPAPPPPLPIHPEYVQQAPIQRPPQPAPARPAERSRPAPTQAARPSGREPAPPPRPAPQRLPPASLPVASGTARSNRQPAPPPPAARVNNLDDTLMRELEVTFDATPAKTPAKAIEMTLDDEMTKLLGELSSHKR